MIDWIDNFGLFNGVGLAMTMIGILARSRWPHGSASGTRFERAWLISALLMASFALLPRDSLGMLFALQVLMQLTFGPTIPLLWAMMADVADYSEWKTGRRSTALAFASIVFGLKLGFGIGGWLNGVLLDYFGYTASAANLPASATRGIVLMISVFPALALLVGVGVLFFYRIDGPTERLMEETLQSRRERGGDLP